LHLGGSISFIHKNVPNISGDRKQGKK